MKEKIHYVIEAVLIVAVIILFVFQFSGNKNYSTGNTSVGSEVSFGEAMPIAYINVDSLIENYTYSTDLNEQLTRMYENSQATLVERGRKLQTEMENFRSKAQTGSFLSQERAELEEARIIKLREEFQNLEQKLTQDFNNEQIRVNTEIRNTIITNLREFNKDKKFHVIYGKMGDNILYADEAYNITDEAIKFLNMKYVASPPTTEEIK